METAMLHTVMQGIVNTFIPPKRWHQNTAHIQYGGIDWLVHYDFSPSEKQERDYPGAPAEAQITEVYLFNMPPHKCLKEFLDEGILAEMEYKVLEGLGEL
jgi:hypothetical protein